MSKLEKEFQYFLANLKEFVAKYEGKYMVIKSENVLGVYDSIEEAISETLKSHEMGTFMVQKCNADEESYTQTFHSRVIFNK